MLRHVTARLEAKWHIAARSRKSHFSTKTTTRSSTYHDFGNHRGIGGVLSATIMEPVLNPCGTSMKFHDDVNTGVSKTCKISKTTTKSSKVMISANTLVLEAMI
ncbi:unnamed protein product [Caenorhabditis angaria]|uniref:Uncharacterized protein n=1 Tax=Caenorhabditis angaria TaxID=860376 RepID=A0A9P1IGE5_9PELO|nr:unnamed protein product [Caenorhabditis angaria]